MGAESAPSPSVVRSDDCVSHTTPFNVPWTNVASGAILKL